MDLFDLAAKITLDSSEYERGLDNAKGKTNGFASVVGNGLKTAAKVGVAAVAAVGTATTLMAGAIVKGVGATAEYGDNIDKMSQKMGLSIEAYQEWNAVMQHSGTSMESMQTGMKTLANAVENGNKAFQRIGLTQEELANMSQEEIFDATIAGLQNVEDETERTYLAGQLLGRGATELGALLNTSAEETQAMKDRVHELGGVMSDEAVKSAAAYQDQLQDMQTAFSGLSRNMLSEFMPSMTTVMGGLTEIFSGNSGTGLVMIEDGINQIVDNISLMLPNFIEIGSDIVGSLIGAILKNLPALIESGLLVIEKIADGILDNLPDLAKTIIPAAIDAAKSVLESVGSAIYDNAPEPLKKFIDAAGDFFASIGQIFSDRVEPVVSAVQDAFERVKNAIQPVIDKIKEYITQGGFASDALGLIQDAADGVVIVISALSDWFATSVEKISEFVTWLDAGSAGAEALKGVIVGIIAAIGAYVAITQALNAIQLVQTAVTNGVAVAQGVLNAIMSANPIGLIIIAITALVAAFAYLWNNSEGFRQFWIDLWEKITNAVNVAIEFVKKIFNGIVNFFSTAIKNIKSTFSNGFNAVKSTITNIFNGIKTFISGVWNGIKSFFSNIWNGIKGIFSNSLNNIKTTVTSVVNTIKSNISSVFNGIKTFFSNIWNGIKGIFSDSLNNIKTTVTSAVNAVKTTFSTGFNAAKNTVLGVFDAIKSGITSKLEAAKNVVSNMIEKIKGFFNFKWSLPSIKLPHFSVSGSANPIDWISQGVPKINISWYKKAYDSPYMFDKRTVIPFTDGLKGFGDGAGGEIVYGRDNLMRDIREAIGGAGGYTQNVYITSPKQLSPSEIARQTRNATRNMVLSMRGV